MDDVKSVLIIGSGKRVVTDAIPVLEKLSCVRIHKIVAKNEKIVESNGTTYQVGKLDDLQEADFKNVSLIYLAVKQNSVVTVLKKLSAFPVSQVDLLMETPVMPCTQFENLSLLERFRNVWVAEDCTTLPWLDLLEKQNQKELKKLYLFRSAYRYHATALIKKLLNMPTISGVRTRKVANGQTQRTYVINNAVYAVLVEPRDYGLGYFMLEYGDLTVVDAPDQVDNGTLMQPLINNNRCTGFRLGEHQISLTQPESDLIGFWEDGAGITSKMHALKRAGLYRLFERIHEGNGAYPLHEAAHDATIEYYVDKLGFYTNRAILDHTTPAGRFLFKLVSLGNRILKKIKL